MLVHGHSTLSATEFLAIARQLEKSKSAAAESWSALQGEVNNAFDSLSSKVHQAYDKTKND